jgi:hypothetical protein
VVVGPGRGSAGAAVIDGTAVADVEPGRCNRVAYTVVVRALRHRAVTEPATAVDLAVVARQLGRTPRGVRGVAHRCVCGLPDVIETAPRLPDGTPFPTFYYLTCPRAASAIGSLEASGMMRDMTARLGADEALAASYAAAHRDYLARRDAVERLPGEPAAGGMPTRVKCLHVLVAHALAAGPGVNPFGDEALAALPAWGNAGPCVDNADIVEIADGPEQR